MRSRRQVGTTPRGTPPSRNACARGIDAPDPDGLSLWVGFAKPARAIADHLMRRGWLARTGDDFALDERAEPSRHLRLTVHDLSEDDTATLIADLVAAGR